MIQVFWFFGTLSNFLVDIETVIFVSTIVLTWKAEQQVSSFCQRKMGKFYFFSTIVMQHESDTGKSRAALESQVLMQRLRQSTK